jgi:hypothetical protein
MPEPVGDAQMTHVRLENGTTWLAYHGAIPRLSDAETLRLETKAGLMLPWC